MADLLPWELTYASPTPAPTSDDTPPWERDYSSTPTFAPQLVTPEGGESVAPTAPWDMLFYKSGQTQPQREELNAPLREAMEAPAVSPETVARALGALGDIGATSPEDLQQGPVQESINRTLANAISGMTSGQGISTLPLYAFPATAAGLTSENVQELPGQIGEAVTQAGQGNYPEAASAGTQAALNALMIGGVMHGGAELTDRVPMPEKIQPPLPPAVVPPPPIGTPLQPVPLLGPNGETPALNVAAAQTQPQVGQLPVSQEGVPPLIQPGDEPYAGVTPPVAEAGKSGTGEGGISIKNEYTDAQRQALGFPEAVQEASRDFGTVWNEAEAADRQDPGAKGRLVEAINEGKVKAVDDLGDALLLREQIRVQGEHNDAVNAVNNALGDSDRTVAKARLEAARDQLQAVYDADRKAGRSTAQGLNARKMLAAEDYSLTRMEARKRAANNGERLSEEQLKQTEALHSEITELSNGLNGLEQLKREARSTVPSGKRFTDFMDEQAQKARERLIAKRGRLSAGIDPTNLVDEAIIGASHIARGLTKFADWSAQMVRDFGDRIKPFLKDLWDRSRAYHDASSKAYRSPEQIRLERTKTRLAKETVGVTAKIQRGDFTKPTRQPPVFDKAAYQMKANLQRLKNEFERGVARDAYDKMSPADKFWQHFVGVERAMKLSSPGVFEKLGVAAAVREALAPIEATGGYVTSKFFPRLAEGTRYGAGLRTIARAEIKAKASLFTQGMKDAWENLKGKETTLEAMSDKYGRQPDFWYNRIGKIHAAIKAPVKRAEFVRSLEHRMDAAVKAGEDINQPQVMDRLATESALDANRAIFQQNTVVSKFFSMLEKASPAAGRVARFLQPVVKIPVNLFKEFVTYNVGGPVAAVRIGNAYWKGIETLEPAAREAIIRQLVKGSVGGAALLWGYFNREKVHDFFASVPPFFEHTPIAMAIHEGSIIKGLEEQGAGTRYRPTEPFKDLTKMARYDIPFAYTVTGLTGALDATNPNGWRDYLYNMIEGSTVPQISSWAAKELDKPTPFSIFDKPTYRQPTNIVQAITQGIPGLRQDVPAYHSKRK